MYFDSQTLKYDYGPEEGSLHVDKSISVTF